MANYRDIKGFQIQSLSSDPVPYAGSWSSGGNMNVSKSRQGTGTQTAGLAIGGQGPVVANVETYNGSTWTEVGDLNTAKAQLGAFGTQPASFAAGGYLGPPGITDTVESWNGTSWTETTEINTSRRTQAGDGSTTAGLIAGGTNVGSTVDGETELWNGSAWTESGDLNTARGWLGGTSAGSTTASLVFGGNGPYPSVVAVCEQFNGTSWTEKGDLNQARWLTQGSGTTTDGLCFGGDTAGGSFTAKTEAFDGTSWTEVNDLVTAVGESAGIGTGSLALTAGGQTPDYTNVTQEWAFPGPTASQLVEGQMWFNTPASALKAYGKAAGIPSTSWASGAAINTGRGIGAGVGDTTAGLIWGGYRASPAAQLTNTESYNGTAWTEVNDLPTAVQFQARGGVGTQTAALSAGGEPTPNNQTESEVWDGSSWAENTEMNTPHVKAGAAGSQTAGIVITSYAPGNENVEVWNGSTWTEVANVNTKGGDGAGFGSSTAAIYTGGERPGTVAITESYDGTAWTEVADLNTARVGLAGSGGQSLGMVAGGFQPPNSVLTESWNGSAWTEVGDLANARYGPLGSGGAQSVSSAVNAFVAGSYNPTNLTATEEFVASSAINTVTTS